LCLSQIPLRLLGFADFQIEGLEGSIPCPVIFAPKGSLFLLGAMAVENRLLRRGSSQ
jgi:hypothetical protein